MRPMPVEEQVMVIFAVTRGLLDDMDVGKIRAWEKGFLEFVRSSHPEIGEAIRDSGKVSATRPTRRSRRRIERVRQMFRETEGGTEDFAQEAAREIEAEAAEAAGEAG